MHRTLHHTRTRRRRAGFTLVELVTAAALMTIMMAGVVEVFGIITTTAGEAEAISYAHQQLRAVLDHLNRDLRGLSRQNYLRISPDTHTSSGAEYHRDALAFVSVGEWTGLQGSRSTGAEVLYTNYVTTPDAFLQVDGESVDPRRGVLGRGVWVLSGRQGTVADFEEASGARVPGELAAAPSLSRPVRAGDQMVVYPWSDGRGVTGPESVTLRRVMATCASEFFVEYWKDWVTDEGWDETSPGGGQWVSTERDDLPLAEIEELFDTEETGVWPKAIRVTIAVHDPKDLSPAESGERFRGYVLQEVFYLGDP